MIDAATPMQLPQASLAGQVAVVTGAGRGIGQAIVRALAHSGVIVVAVSRTPEELDQTVALVRIPTISPGFVAAMRDHTVLPEEAGHLAAALAALREPRLSGRLFEVTSLLHDANGRDRTVAEGVTELVLQEESIAQNDRYTLRLRL